MSAERESRPVVDAGSALWPRLALVALCAVLFFPGLGERDLWNPDEPRYAEVTREMIATGDYLVPHLNGEIYTHKPPLMFWAMALSSGLSGGLDETAVRLPSALAATGVVLLIFAIGRRLFGLRAGVVAALAFATCIKAGWQARVGQIDMVLTFFVTLTAYLWIRAWREERSHLYLLGFLSAGFGTLAKGPAALLPLLLAFVVFHLDEGRRSGGWDVGRREVGRMGVGRGLLLWAAVVLAWLLPAGFAAAAASGGWEYLHELLVTQNLTRYTAGADYAGTAAHLHPWYYYLYVVPVEFLPWTLLVPGALWIHFRRADDTRRRDARLLVAWVVVTLVFFSLSPAKRSVYVLQLYPALALLVGSGLDLFVRFRDERERETSGARRAGRWLVLPAGLFGVLAVAAAGILIHLGPRHPDAALLPHWVPTGMGIVFAGIAVGALAAAWLFHRRRHLGAAGVLGAAFGSAMLFVVLVVLPTFEPYKSTRPIAERYLELAAADESYGLYPDPEPSLYFYTGRFAERLETEAELRRFLARPERSWLFVERDDLAGLELPPGVGEVARGPDPENGYVLFSTGGTRPEALLAETETSTDSRSWWYGFFNVRSVGELLWVACGLLGQALFTGRMLVQWIASERRRESVVPVAFWWLSLAGASMLLAYFAWRRDVVGILGQATGWMVYARNLYLLHRERPGLADLLGSLVERFSRIAPRGVRPSAGVLLPVLLVSLPASLVVTASASHAVTLRSADAKMGSQFEVTVVAADAATAERAAAAAWAEIDRVEALISSWRPDSQTTRINEAAGREPVVVSQELFDLVRRSLSVAKLTGGAFDPTFGGVGRLWDFGRREGGRTRARLPDPEELREALELVDWRRVELDPARRSVYLPKEGMRLGFGAIGKGYAANRAVWVLEEHGIESGVVSAGGDLVAFGRRENGEPWTVGLADPRRPGELLGRLVLTDTAVVTSGDYERFVEIDGERYAHILDPRTGWPVRGVGSVTVVCPDGELADALATAVFVLGPDEGLRLIDRLRGIEALVIDHEGRLHASENFRQRLEDGTWNERDE